MSAGMSAPPTLARRLVLLGDEALSDAELVAIICGVSVDEAVELSRGDRPPRRPAGLRWQALLAWHRRRARPPDARLPTLSSASAAAALLRADLAQAAVEELHVLALDTRNRLLRRVMVARGGVNQVCVSAREVFRPLVAAGAARAIVAHNHPSGCATPSEEDRQLTARLAVAGDLLGVPIVDHLVIASDGYYSFAERERNGLMRA